MTQKLETPSSPPKSPQSILSEPSGAVSLTSEAVSRIDDEASLKAKPEASIPYSIYSNQQKWIIVGLASSIALFSPLGANIFFPAIPSLSDAFHKSVQDIK